MMFRKKKEEKKRRVGKIATGLLMTGLIGYGIKKLLDTPSS